MFPSLEGFTMKPFQAFGCRALLLVLILHGGVECRPIQGNSILLKIVRFRKRHLQVLIVMGSWSNSVVCINRPDKLAWQKAKHCS